MNIKKHFTKTFGVNGFQVHGFMSVQNYYGMTFKLSFYPTK